MLLLVVSSSSSECSEPGSVPVLGTNSPTAKLLERHALESNGRGREDDDCDVGCCGSCSDERIIMLLVLLLLILLSPTFVGCIVPGQSVVQATSCLYESNSLSLHQGYTKRRQRSFASDVLPLPGFICLPQRIHCYVLINVTIYETMPSLCDTNSLGSTRKNINAS